MATYTVVKDDCLWDIAKAKLGSGTRWQEIAKLNTSKYPSLKNSTIIQIGWVLELPGSSGSTTKSTASNVAVVEFLGPLAGKDRTLFLTWSWSKDKASELDKYLIEWIYTVEGNRTLYATQTVSVDEGYDAAVYKQTTWTVPENALTVKVKVKPVAKKKTVNNKETTPWTAGWSTISTKAMFFASKFPPEAPNAPTVKLEGDTLTMELTVSDYDYADRVAFQVFENYTKAIVVVNNVKMTYGHAAYTCKLKPGNTYVARCRVCKNDLWSEYSNYSSEIVSRPVAPTKLTAKALSENDIYLEWNAVANVTGYEYQYTTKKDYFDTSSQVTTGNVDSTVHCANLVDLETGNFTYFFRVRSKGEGGESDWSNIATLTLGKAPAAPTTWSSTTTAITGVPVNLYWVHNSEDGSSQTFAKLELNVDGTVTTQTIQNTTDEEERDNTSVFTLDTSAYPEGAKILWRVCTAGVLTSKYGDWSVQREIDVYAQPTIDLRVTKNLEGEALDDLTSFPFYIEASAGPASQLPIGYHLKIVANEGYETVDRMGNPVIVSAGEAVYSKYFDNNFEINGVSDTSLYVMMTPANIDLENNISYTLTCTVSMNSGLTAEDFIVFTVAWEDISYLPNAEIGYDPESYSTLIRPYCEDVDGNLVEGITLSVYRREYDGTFTEIETDIPNNGYTFITDPHPALDYARYRVIATVEETGAIGFYDVPGYPISEPAAIIQWNEEWSTFDAVEAEPLATPAWTGSLVRLPYNIDISPSNAKDVSLVEYMGRKYPVAYYGTQLGESVSLKTDIPATDRETLYALRRLMIWKGDVYVRLPNGIGHWATVSVQYNENHCEVKIPVTIDITRVEGGV